MSSGTLVVYNNYDWKLDPRWGRIVLTVDLKRAGRIDVRQHLPIQLAEGTPHEIRARLWWFRADAENARSSIPKSGAH